MNKLGFSGASSPSSISTFNWGSICQHLLSLYNKKQNKTKKFAEPLLKIFNNKLYKILALPDIFPIKANPPNLEFLNHAAKNIPVVLLLSPIKKSGKSVKVMIGHKKKVTIFLYRLIVNDYTSLIITQG